MVQCEQNGLIVVSLFANPDKISFARYNTKDWVVLQSAHLPLTVPNPTNEDLLAKAAALLPSLKKCPFAYPAEGSTSSLTDKESFFCFAQKSIPGGLLLWLLRRCCCDL